MSYAQCELGSNVSYGWNLLKRINNNYFSSNTLLFLTNTQRINATRSFSCHVSHIHFAVWAEISVGDGAFVAVQRRRLTLRIHKVVTTSPQHLGTEARYWWMRMLGAQEVTGAAELKLDPWNRADDSSGVSKGRGGRQWTDFQSNICRAVFYVNSWESHRCHVGDSAASQVTMGTGELILNQFLFFAVPILFFQS